MRYAYYPGCSLEATGRSYDESTRAVAATLGVELEELDDWNCCGATTYMSVRETLAASISARNLCLAQRAGRDIVAPCSACFTVLRKTDHYLHDLPDLRGKVSSVLSAADLAYDPGSVRVLHLLQAFLENDCLEKLREVPNPLKGLRVAPYYGCQIVRPKVDFDNAEFPTTLDQVISALGATPVYYPVKARCCGASLMASNQPAALRMSKNLLLCAQQNSADMLVTVCPLCQINLDAFQGAINATYGTRFKVPVLYFTQLIGMALGLPDKALGIGREIVDPRPLLHPFASRTAALGVH
jgi:heterodisulfide reductase subunit B2